MYWLRVTGEQVNVRSRPDANSLIITRVPKNTLLVAEGSEFGWHRIVPPPDAFSYVSGQYIDRRSQDMGIVSVRSGNLRVRVGSRVQDVAPIRCEVQTLLPRGAAVQIIGQREGWLMIVPPAEVRAYISADYVERVTREVAADLPQPEAAPAAMAASASAAQALVDADGATSQPAGAPDLSGAWGKRLVAIESAIHEEGCKPAEEQDWGQFTDQLEPIVRQREEPFVSRLAEAWVGKLERRAAAQEALQAARDVLRRTSRERAQHERELERIDRMRQGAAARSLYDAEGELQRSFVVGARIEERVYRLEEPGTRRVVVYLRADPGGKIDMERFLGKRVGVRGERRFDPKLGGDVLRVLSIVELAADEPPDGAATTDS